MMSPSLTARHIGFIVVVLGISVAAVYSADTHSYCFKFTWVGPEYDNDTLVDVANKTCKEMGFAAPCVEPLVVTFDGTPPDTDLIWETYDRDQVSCRLTRNTVCLKWVNYYDGVVENITYTCGKMTGPKGPIRDGCETWKRGVYRSQACSCRTPVVNGDPRIPCNSSSQVTVNFWTCLFILTSTFLALRGANSHFIS